MVHPQLFSQLSLVPESLQIEVVDFVEFLLGKKAKNGELIKKGNLDKLARTSYKGVTKLLVLLIFKSRKIPLLGLIVKLKL